MNKRNNKLFLTCVFGFLIGLFFPFSKTMGLSFDVLLVSLFGEDSIWAGLFSLFLIAILALSLRKIISKTAS
ncbi:hypothetical protein MKY27_09245 [Solibacillus sp. FSL R5-0449]|uniref:hypothetical protein n=1 Tax=Solibacillus sp. FSL R5-0449 TaxID=2921639 RepID=UPI0030CBEE13